MTFQGYTHTPDPARAVPRVETAPFVPKQPADAPTRKPRAMTAKVRKTRSDKGKPRGTSPRKANTEPSARNRKVWRAICEYDTRHGGLPIPEELAAALGMNRTTLIYHLHALARFGVVKSPGYRRGARWRILRRYVGGAS